MQRGPAGVVGNKVTMRMMGADQDLLEEGGETPLVPREWGPSSPRTGSYRWQDSHLLTSF